ncbi:MAG: hypothetical protein RXR17_09220 [Sulfolobaceae archaeon]
MSQDKERKLQKLDQDLYKKYLEVRERNLAEREKFKQEIKEIVDKVQKRLEKYGVIVVVDFDERSTPSTYDIIVRFPRKRLNEELFREFISDAKKIGLVYNPQTKTWGYVDEYGKYPPFNL